MRLVGQLTAPDWFVLTLAVCVSLGLWLLVAVRAWRGMPVLPYQPRRCVPWQGIDLLVVMVIFCAAAGTAIGLADPLLGPEVTRPPDMYDVKTASTDHPIARLLYEGDVWILLLCGLSAVLAIPIVEEFLFRLLLQGWLEAGQRRLRPKMPVLRRLVPGAVGPIFLTSAVFASMHFHVAGPARHPGYYVFQTVCTVVVGLVTMALAIGLLRLRHGATAADLGWVPEKFFADVKLGLVTFAGLAAPIYAAMFVLKNLVLPEYLAPDPFVLFFFSLALGTLYYRTHRLVPAIVLHMALNLTSLAMLIAKRALQ